MLALSRISTPRVKESFLKWAKKDDQKKKKKKKPK